MKPDASQSGEVAPAEKEEAKEPPNAPEPEPQKEPEAQAEKEPSKEPEKEPEKIEETPQPPAKEGLPERPSAEHSSAPQPESKPEVSHQAAPTRDEIFPPTSKPDEPTQPTPQTEQEKPTESAPPPTTETPNEAPRESDSGKSNAFDAMMAGKSPEDPQPEAPKATSSTEQPKEDSQQVQDSTPPVPPNTQAEPPKQEPEKPTYEPSQQESNALSNLADPPKQEPEKPADGPSTNDINSSHQEEKKEPAPTTNGDATVEPKAREDDVPSSILEKGIVYFFFRARVNITDPQDVTDIARSYIVLRPLPHGAALSDGPIPEANNSRLIALPKKVLPLSGKDRFMAFVEKSKVSFTQLKDDFMSASDYATKTQGTSHTPPVTPVAEGVYAITTTGRESHLVYMTTIPSSLGEVQKDIGLRDSGSFVVSAKNPKFPGPANASLDKSPEYPEDIMTEFRDLRWMPLQPKLLDYVNTQFLLIGESKGVEGALEGLPRDEKQEKDTPMEEMQRLEGEDEIRVRHLKGKSTLSW